MGGAASEGSPFLRKSVPSLGGECSKPGWRESKTFRVDHSLCLGPIPEPICPEWGVPRESGHRSPTGWKHPCGVAGLQQGPWVWKPTAFQENWGVDHKKEWAIKGISPGTRTQFLGLGFLRSPSRNTHGAPMVCLDMGGKGRLACAHEELHDKSPNLPQT